jgi:hypothetical protein
MDVKRLLTVNLEAQFPQLAIQSGQSLLDCLHHIRAERSRLYPWVCMRGVCLPATGLRNDCDLRARRSRMRWRRCIRATRPTNIRTRFNTSGTSTYKLRLSTAMVRSQPARRQLGSRGRFLLADRSFESRPAPRLDFRLGLDSGGRDDHGGGGRRIYG